MLGRRHVLIAAGALAAPAVARAQETPGVTATEIRIGSTIRCPGRPPPMAIIGRCTAAMFKRLNDQGGIAGRKINFIVYDDGLQPAEDGGAGPPADRAGQGRLPVQHARHRRPTAPIHRYVNQRKVPHLFLATGADKWADPKEYPWTIGWQPSYRIEAQIYAQYILEQKPAARSRCSTRTTISARTTSNGLKDVLGAALRPAGPGATYEATDPTIDSQVVRCRRPGPRSW